jgi:hypothetical protein
VLKVRIKPVTNIYQVRLLTLNSKLVELSWELDLSDKPTSSDLSPHEYCSHEKRATWPASVLSISSYMVGSLGNIAPNSQLIN